jgi:AGCS family alanine or glycine:cation symporter
MASALVPTLPAYPGTVSALASRRSQARSGAFPAEGEISSFQALSTALAATVGTGNIVGVATAIALGGPGAVFWMWATAILGAATKFSEATLALNYRVKLPTGEYAGGPMYYIRDGMRSHPRWLAWVFAFFTAAAAFGTGNLIQSNSVAQAMQTSFRAPLPASGALIAGLTGAVVLGGIRRIGRVAATVVPVMTLFYAAASLWAIWTSRAAVPGVLAEVIRGAFSPAAATGGFAGATVALALRAGVARGLLSNEAGLGSAPIAHAAAKASHPAEEGMVAMLGAYIDTLIIGTLTAFVILTTGVWRTGATGPELSATAFRIALPGPGDLVVSLGLIFFAFTTIIGWAYYGERAVAYIAGPRAVLPYRVAWTAAAFAGAVGRVRAVWAFSDIMNGLMALPNLIAVIALSGVVARIARNYATGVAAGRQAAAPQTGQGGNEA